MLSGQAGYISQNKPSKAQFIMPQQPINPSNSTMAGIGRKVIQSNINIEAEFKKKIGTQQANSPAPKTTEAEIIDVLQACRVTLTQDERVELQAFVTNNREIKGSVNLLAFLKSVGLPA